MTAFTQRRTARVNSIEETTEAPGARGRTAERSRVPARHHGVHGLAPCGVLYRGPVVLDSHCNGGGQTALLQVRAIVPCPKGPGHGDDRPENPGKPLSTPKREYRREVGFTWPLPRENPRLPCSRPRAG